jgi:hypothetical protein
VARSSGLIRVFCGQEEGEETKTMQDIDTITVAATDPNDQGVVEVRTGAGKIALALSVVLIAMLRS